MVIPKKLLFQGPRPALLPLHSIFNAKRRGFSFAAKAVFADKATPIEMMSDNILKIVFTIFTLPPTKEIV